MWRHAPRPYLPFSSRIARIVSGALQDCIYRANPPWVTVAATAPLLLAMIFLEML
jgi:hypothetical protein